MAEVFLTRLYDGLYPLGLVGRIRIFLTLQADADVLWIGTVLVLDVQFVANTLEITTVYLYTRLVGKHFHEDTSLGRIEAGANLCVVALAILISCLLYTSDAAAERSESGRNQT